MIPDAKGVRILRALAAALVVSCLLWCAIYVAAHAAGVLR